MRSDTHILASKPHDTRRRVGRYELMEIIGSGGMGVVYRGVLRADGGFTRTVAIKKLKPELTAHGRYVAALIDEAKISGHVKSPHAIEVIDVVHVDAEFFLVMPFVDGASLDRVLGTLTASNTPWPSTEIAVGLVVQVLRGLEAAHRARDAEGKPLGIVHRDVSPSNVHLGKDGVARVIDFGIAKAAVRTQQETETGVLKGKPSYMAPEQLVSGEADPRSDLFSVGVVLYELLTGLRLRPHERLLAAVNGGTALPATLFPEDEDLTLSAFRDVLGRLLAVSPDARPGTAKETIAILEAIHPNAVLAAQSWAMTAVGTMPHAPAAAPGADETPHVTMAPLSVSPERSIARGDVATHARAGSLGRRGMLALGVLASVAVGATSAAIHAKRSPASPSPGTTMSPLLQPEISAPAVANSPSTSPSLPAPEPSPPHSLTGSGASGSTRAPHAPTSSPRHLPPRAAGERPDCRVPFELAPDGTKIPKRACY